MNFTDERFPAEIDVHPQHAGRLGEVLFTSMREPPEPIPEILSDVCRSKVPEKADIERLAFIRTSQDSGKQFYSIERENKTLSWENDATITIGYDVQDIVEQEIRDEPSLRWMVECPVEIKTGPYATTGNDQREVMEYLAENTEYQPIIVRLDIESLPAAFSLTELEIIGR